MSRKDGTGPEGEGPKTGRGAGNCGRKDKRQQPTGREDGQGRGQGRGKGQGGRGRGRQR